MSNSHYKKYEIAFNFTSDRQEDLKEGILSHSVAIRLIKAEIELEPCCDNGDGDLRYETDNPEVMMRLIKILLTDSKNGGNISINPMPDGKVVYHILTE